MIVYYILNYWRYCYSDWVSLITLCLVSETTEMVNRQYTNVLPTSALRKRARRYSDPKSKDITIYFTKPILTHFKN